MQAIRKRNPFTFQSEDHVNGGGVLDEQGINSFVANKLPTIACLPAHRTGRGGRSNQGPNRFVEQAEPNRSTTNARNVMYTVRRFSPTSPFLSEACCRRYIIYMLSDRTTPLFAIFPPLPEAGRANAPLDMSGILAYIAILIHVNLSLIVHPWNVVVAGRAIQAIGFLETFAWSAAGPLLSLYSGRAWQTTMWWCIPGFLTYVVYAVHGWIRKAGEDVSELEKLQYRASGA